MNSPTSPRTKQFKTSKLLPTDDWPMAPRTHQLPTQHITNSLLKNAGRIGLETVYY